MVSEDFRVEIEGYVFQSAFTWIFYLAFLRIFESWQHWQWHASMKAHCGACQVLSRATGPLIVCITLLSMLQQMWLHSIVCAKRCDNSVRSTPKDGSTSHSMRAACWEAANFVSAFEFIDHWNAISASEKGLRGPLCITMLFDHVCARYCVSPPFSLWTSWPIFMKVRTNTIYAARDRPPQVRTSLSLLLTWWTP